MKPFPLLISAFICMLVGTILYFISDYSIMAWVTCILTLLFGVFLFAAKDSL